MATRAQIIALAENIAHERIGVDAVDWTDFTDQDRCDVIAFACYELSRLRQRPSNRKARRLLQSWLTVDQRAELQRGDCFAVVGSAGGQYRIRSNGHTDRVERHGRRWFAKAAYCLHDDPQELPGPDLALAHLLLLRTDESLFLALANEHPRNPWDGDWRRRLNAARRARVVAA